MSNSWCTTHTDTHFGYNQPADQSAAVQVLRSRAGMISCEVWQRVCRLAWHRLAPCRQRLFSCAKASITQMREQGELEIAATGWWDENLPSDADTTAKQKEGQEATYQSMLCHEQDGLRCHIAVYEVTAVCVCVCACVGGTATVFCAKVYPACRCQDWLHHNRHVKDEKLPCTERVDRK